ncbi:hypothetical protein Pint_06983 [Pistacia integerrima]|uniref:Uncharacterized protein n=1 Tax=Pistacia integerrima TaxID=434235 RepID=A0ACC0XXC9_9ROSI|nr:hypothetical protein Pint_06983 [Pistacia integerrima]
MHTTSVCRMGYVTSPQPSSCAKERVELDRHVGHGRLAEEPDLVKLPYLQRIINETLWCFRAPLLVPHESSNYRTIGGYDVPPSTMLIVNAWSIHRYPKVWEDPESSRPERYEGLEREVEAYNFIPFGRGRRFCPRAGLANRVMGLALATLIQCFEWERISEKEVDLTEGTGLTMPKVKAIRGYVQSSGVHVKCPFKALIIALISSCIFVASQCCSLHFL